MNDLSNVALLNRLKSHLSSERAVFVEFLRTLAEVDRRQLHLELGYQNLGEYCQKELGLREGESWNRVKVALVARRLPVVYEMLADGRHCLTTVRALAPYLSGDDAIAILERSAGKTTRDVERIVGDLMDARELAKRPAQLPLDTRLAASSPSTTQTVAGPSNATQTVLATGTAQAHPSISNDPQPTPVDQRGRRRKRETIRHVSAETISLTFEADAALRETLDRVMAVRRAQGKEATLAAAMAAMMEAYLDKHDHARRLARGAKKKAALAAKVAAKIAKGAETAAMAMSAEAATAKPATSANAATGRPKAAAKGRHPTSRHIPARVEHAVFSRDGYRCAHVGPTGVRCAATAGLHRDHVRPFALGGASDEENIRFLCRQHNRLAAGKTFGHEMVRRIIAARRAEAVAP